MKIAFLASECVPFVKTGGLADVVGALPKVLAARGHQVTVFLPRYARIRPGPPCFADLEIRMGGEIHRVALHEGGRLEGVQFYFVDYAPYFDRPELYMTAGKDYPDNAERFALFCRGVLESLKRLGRPAVIHAHDWQAALVPVLLKTDYAKDSRLAGLPSVFTVHNIGYQGLFPLEALTRLGLPDRLLSLDGLEYYGKLNFLKGGLLFADLITTVSKKYAREIQTREYGCGLEGVIRWRADALVGILNGVDYGAWNPETDKFLAANYSRADLAGKRRCKEDLLRRFRLPAADLRKPVVGLVGRLTRQKGFDLVAEAADALMKHDLQITALGTGEPEYEKLFRKLASRFPDRVGARIAYDDALAHKIEAGADLFLMPSRYEPCGLNQIYSLKYGTVPVVRATGGLDDTIEPFDPASGRGTGFKFEEYTPAALVGCLTRALRVYHDQPAAWQRLMRNGMEKDYSWGASAAEYERAYQRVVESV